MGRLFHKIGAQTEKALSPYRVLVRGPGASWDEDEDLRLMEGRVLGVNSSAMYDGSWCRSILYVMRRTLNCVRRGIGSQCSE